MVIILGVRNLGLQTTKSVVFRVVRRKCTLVGGHFLGFQCLLQVKKKADCLKETSLDRVSFLRLPAITIVVHE
jgi:hypothetical protein